MGKFGHKNKIDLNPLNVAIGILGEPGIGKSTLAKTVCEKLAGPDGYLALDVGKECGHNLIANIVTEEVPDWEKFVEVVDDIVENKAEDYPDLKVVIVDTFDALMELAEQETVRLYKKTEAGQKLGSNVTINNSFGGYGRGLDKAIDLVLTKLWELRTVGVQFMIIAHVKRTEISDIFTDEKYTMLTCSTTQRYFNAIKQKIDVCAVCYLDRDIVKEKTGKKDPKSGREIERGKIVGESRVINFRDDTFSVDSKSRLACIVDRVPMDADEFVKAITDALVAEQANDGRTLTQAKKETAAAEKDKVEKAASASKEARVNKIDPDRNDEIVGVLKEKMTTTAIKAAVKNKMEELGIPNFKDVGSIPTAKMEELYKIVEG